MTQHLRGMDMATGMANTFYNDFDRTCRYARPMRAGDYRTVFQRDRDGVIYSSAFRRLQAKTQVFLSGQYDFYRTRLTHSIEVAQIGRSICGWLATAGAPLDADFHVDQDLVEAVCLAHDLGHPPFGHAGERTLHRLMQKNYGGFEGNAQSLRIVTETIFSSGDGVRRGLDPTRAFVDGVMKYKRLWNESGGAPNHFLYEDQGSWREFALPGWEADIAPFVDANAFHSIECQIMDWADDTAYSLNDVADGVNAGFLDSDRIAQWADRRTAERPDERQHIDDLLDAMRRGLIDAWAGRRIGKFISACRAIERDNPMSARTNRYRFGIEVDPAVLAEAALYKALSVELVFRSPKIRQLEYKGDSLLERVFRALGDIYLREGAPAQDAGLLPESFHARLAGEAEVSLRARHLCDYLAGMTDGYATRMFKRLFDPDFGSIVELA